MPSLCKAFENAQVALVRIKGSFVLTLWKVQTWEEKRPLAAREVSTVTATSLHACMMETERVGVESIDDLLPRNFLISSSPAHVLEVYHRWAHKRAVDLFPSSATHDTWSSRVVRV